MAPAPASNAPSPPLPLPPDSVYTSCYCEENIYLLAKTFAAGASAPGRGLSWPWEPYVVFVSNSGKTVALWSQKARKGVVVWDYHVFLVLRPRPRILPHTAAECTSSDFDQEACAPFPQHDGCEPAPEGDHAWVYDFDTTLPVPCPWREYVAGTFPYAFDDALSGLLDERFLSLFRVISADEYLDGFASDRSHMIVSGAVEELAQSGAGGGDAGGMGGGPQYSMPPPPYPPICGPKARALGIVNNLMESYVTMHIERRPASMSDAKEEGAMPAFASTEVGLDIASPDDGHATAEARSAGMMAYGRVMDMEGFVQWISGRQNAGL